ncbi:transcription factor S-II central domain-containing protein [Rossellomorea sp. KS-H15a]|uniref:transcription factor S-II central domain-containing protein n=1 Tax=Rossellomorea sp. KS-H15a TaxID=2963940 RepID=UPI0020C71670|nr:transcription factor S-II central domain-containing protein [Rossellomorea sp. KS-H15a]UTE77535.1 transcription factor S-II central domain-containing protein [Rossellomorea sp. KS-H15a]
MNKQIVSVGISLLLIMILGIINTPFLSTVAETAPKVIDISLDRGETFIELNALKPGDRILDSIKVKNDGNVNITYNHFAEFRGGSEKYFNKILLNVKDSNNNILYEGLIKDFNEIESRKLAKRSTEELFYEYIIPPELGNEYQGLSTSILLKYYAEEYGGTSNADHETPSSGSESPNSQHDEEIKGVKDPTQSIHVNSQGTKLPNTATNIYKILALGIILTTLGLIFVFINRRFTKER